MRRSNLQPLEAVDCVVLGGGITGAGVARDAAMRGLITLLVDSHDFASGTSHLTSKLVHGGLRYLEHGHIRLVWEGIVERDRLLNRMAPNLVSPLRFVIPFEPHRMPKWLLTLSGLQLYGMIERVRAGRRSMPLSRFRLRRDYPLLCSHPFGVSFWDAQTNDARLVMATLRTAACFGAALRNYTSLVDARFDGDAWSLEFHDELEKRTWSLRASVVINATGPWSPHTAERLGAEPMDLMWVKGSHILLRRPPAFGNDAIVIRSPRDLRPLWVIPWENRLIVGSTESIYQGDLRDVRATREEVDDLFGGFQHYFAAAGLDRSDIQCTYAGVRPIVSQAASSENELSRRHEICVDADYRLITITGGKLTTFRRMAEKALDEVDKLLGRPAAEPELRRRLRLEFLWPMLSRPQAVRLIDTLLSRYGQRIAADGRIGHLVRLYGRDAVSIVETIARRPHLGEPIQGDLPYCLAELSYLCGAERVRRLSDLLKRRTSLYFLADRGWAASVSLVAEHIGPQCGWERRRQIEEIEAVLNERMADCQSLYDVAMAAAQPLRAMISA